MSPVSNGGAVQTKYYYSWLWFTRPGLRIDNSIPTGKTCRRSGSARHGILVADPFQDRNLLQPQGTLSLQAPTLVFAIMI